MIPRDQHAELFARQHTLRPSRSSSRRSPAAGERSRYLASRSTPPLSPGDTVIVLSSHSSERYGPVARDPGARAYIEKIRTTSDLVSTARALLDLPRRERCAPYPYPEVANQNAVPAGAESSNKDGHPLDDSLDGARPGRLPKTPPRLPSSVAHNRPSVPTTGDRWLPLGQTVFGFAAIGACILLSSLAASAQAIRPPKTRYGALPFPGLATLFSPPDPHALGLADYDGDGASAVHTAARARHRHWGLKGAERGLGADFERASRGTVRGATSHLDGSASLSALLVSATAPGRRTPSLRAGGTRSCGAERGPGGRALPGPPLPAAARLPASGRRHPNRSRSLSCQPGALRTTLRAGITRSLTASLTGRDCMQGPAPGPLEIQIDRWFEAT